MENRENRLIGKKVFISGAGSGIGKSIAIRFAQEGADLALNDINEESLQQTATEIEKFGHKTLLLPGDVSDLSSVKKICDGYFSEWKELDVLINNAGIGASASQITSMKEEVFDRIIQVNLRSVFLMCKYFAKKMKKRDIPEPDLKGKIINMSSMRGIKGRSNFGAYSAAKAGVLSLTETLAIELGKYRITVNALCPGLIYTPIYGNISCEDLSSMGEPVCIKSKNVGLPEDVAGAAFFLASDDSDWITGQYIAISGGQFGIL